MTDSWKTPKNLFDFLNARYHFDFDPCPINGALGLDPEISWGKRNFVNPPYSKTLKEAFIRRGIEEHKKGNLSVFLIPVSTSTKIFHDEIWKNANEIYFLEGRPAFEGVNSFGKKVSTKTGQTDLMVVTFLGVKRFAPIPSFGQINFRKIRDEKMEKDTP